jgi:lactoylglutathione lyase
MGVKMVKFGYTILYVSDVQATVAFYEKAFGLSKGFVVETGDYGEMITGDTKLSFASEELALSNSVEFEIKSNRTKSPAMEIALICENVEIAFAKAVKAGAKAVALPKSKPWGQVVAYVTDNNGFLVELCTPMAS